MYFISKIIINVDFEKPFCLFKNKQYFKMKLLIKYIYVLEKSRHISSF